MTLEMRPQCERCAAALTGAESAYICSYECTFCFVCAKGMKFVCPNCDGELVSRPRRSN